MQENESLSCSQRSTVIIREALHDDIRILFKFLSVFTVPAQLIKGRCDDGRGGSVPGFGRYLGRIEIPVRHFILRQIRMPEDKLGNMLRLFQVGHIFRFTEAHRVSVEGPGLAPCPGGFMGISLVGIFFAHCSCGGIIIDHMVAAVITSEVILHGCIGVCNGYFIK